MKKFLLSVSAIFTFILFSNAQTITLEQMTPQIGDTYIQGTGNAADPGSAGQNQTWDLSGITALQNVTGTIASPSGLPGSANFPTATFAISNPYQTGYSAIQDNRIEIVGLYQSDAIMTYPNPQTQMQFPLSYQATYTDTYERLADFYGFENQETGSLSVVVDGAGTLITPSGTFTDVLRLKQEINADVILMMEGDYVSTSAFTSTSYIFVKAGYSVPLASITTSDFDGTSSSFSVYLVEASVGLTTLPQVSDIKIFPVPAVNDLNIALNLEASEKVAMSLLSMNGQTVCDYGREFLAAGENYKTLRIPDHTPGGIYILQITTSESIISRKIVIQ